MDVLFSKAYKNHCCPLSWVMQETARFSNHHTRSILTAYIHVYIYYYKHRFFCALSFNSIQAFVKDNLFANDFVDCLLDSLTAGAHSKLMKRFKEVSVHLFIYLLSLFRCYFCCLYCEFIDYFSETWRRRSRTRKRRKAEKWKRSKGLIIDTPLF